MQHSTTLPKRPSMLIIIVWHKPSCSRWCGKGKNINNDLLSIEWNGIKIYRRGWYCRIIRHFFWLQTMFWFPHRKYFHV